MFINQVMDVISMGIVILDSKYSIVEWNKWMEIQSRKKKEDVLDTIIFKHYPLLSSPSFLRSCKSVLNFGNYVFYSQKLHNFLFPFEATGYHANFFEKMQQSCTMTPLKDDEGKITHIVITIQDVTESVYLEKSLKMMTRQDSLTGIMNRQYLDKRLEEEFTRFKRQERAFCLLMIDIDNFKSVNDTYGHQFGDVVLKELSLISKSMIRGSDILARYGGEEFCIVLPETDKKGAACFAERLRYNIEKMEVISDQNKPVKITISIGIAEINKLHESSDEILNQADKALYDSKAKGKNCITLY